MGMYDNEDQAPVCDTCGAELTTGLMAVFCPRGKQCEFYPDDKEGQKFVDELRENAENAA